MGIASTRSQLPICDLIIDGAFKCLSVYKHGRECVKGKEGKVCKRGTVETVIVL